MSSRTDGPKIADKEADKSMTVEEALQVPWLSNYPKPLGELMDEGYLDASRLEWAADKAYNARLKEAAQVLLERKKDGTAENSAKRQPGAAKELPRGLGIGLEQAEATLWPFREYKGKAMGPLVRTGRLSLKDLGYAIESAWDDRVRRAAIALSLVRLDRAIEESPPAAGPLNVVTGSQRSYAQRRQLQMATWQGAIGGGVLGLLLMLVISMVRSSGSSTSVPDTIGDIVQAPEGIIAVVVVLVGALGVYFGLSRSIGWAWNRLEREIEAYRKGEAGEEVVVEKARRGLNGNWTLFRNIVLPGKESDLDIVLVGPPGVWALEVKAKLGAYKNDGESWAYRSGRRWKRLKENPGHQARRAALALKDFLRADGVNTYVHDVVVWAEPEAAIFQENPKVPVWPLDRLEDEFGNLTNDKPLPETDRARIEEKLTRLCRAGKEWRR